ncbi:MAG: DUF4340 domain-containing protein [Opitutae bacterium]|nr:DUF4340 domain-containing protein [Opitutae bacterium]
MRTKVTLVLLFLNVALFFFIFYLRPQWLTEERLKETRSNVLPSEAANIQALEIVAGTQTVRLVKRGETWALTQPFDWPANPHAVSPILNALQFLKHETSFAVADLAKNGQSLASYGLEKPTLTVTIVTGAPAGAEPPRLTLRIGDTTKDGNRLYVLSPDGKRIHVVERSLAESLTLPLEQLRSDELLTIQVFEVRSFNLEVRAANPQSVSPANRIRLRHDGNRWLFETPITARASKTATELAIKDLNGLRVKSFVPQPPAPELNPATSPTLRVTLEGNNRRETLLLGGQLPAAPTAAGAKPADAHEFYGQMEAREGKPSVIFTVLVKDDLIKALRKAQDELRERRLFEFEPAAVTAITLRAPDAPELMLQRLESAAGSESTPWQIVRRDGAQAPVTQPADRGAVQRLLEKLGQLAARDFLNDAPTSADIEGWGFNRPVREIAVTTANAGSAAAPVTTTLKIGVGPARGATAFASFGNPPYVYAIDAEILRDLPVELRAWRDRRLRELPAGAQITGLKLTEPATKAVLLEKTLAPATPPDAAVQKLLEPLRSLRAQAFVADRFTPTANVAGEERPWKYQLDLTVTLVGGASAQTTTSTLFFTERLGGGTQLAGSPDLDAVFEIEQPLLDALWTITYGPHDPGPVTSPAAQPAAPAPAPATPPVTPPAATLATPAPAPVTTPAAPAAKT